ncbi:MAG: sugar phosphate isomerase/epimerase family protein [Zavarzinella sp.]
MAPMKTCISQCTLMNTPMPEDLAAIVDVGWQAVELWLTKVEQYLQTHTTEQLQGLWQQHQVKPVAASYQGGLLISQGEQRQAMFDQFRQRLDLCQLIGVPLMVLAPDVAPQLDEISLQRMLVSLTQAAQWASGYGIELAVEFRTGTCCTNLETAIELVEQCQQENLGICLDLYHFIKGPSKTEDLDRLTPHNLKHVQLCDSPWLLREMMVDSERVMPGDGNLPIASIVSKLQAIGYAGHCSLELMNPTIWAMKPTQVAELGKMAMDRILESKQ